PFLDQHPTNPATASDNHLIRDFLAAAQRRKIKTWLAAVVNMLPADKLKSKPWHESRRAFRRGLPVRVGIYDLDSAEVCDCAVQIFSELHELFPGVHGFVVEVEHSGLEAAHRIPRYNRWAKKHGRPQFAKIARPLQPRLPDLSPWRDYTTE